MDFLELTDTEDRKIWVHILSLHVTRADSGGDSCYCYVDHGSEESAILVKESYEEIKAKLNALGADIK